MILLVITVADLLAPKIAIMMPRQETVLRLRKAPGGMEIATVPI